METDKPESECANPAQTNCLSCKHLKTRETEGKGHFLLWGCKKLGLLFGICSDFRAGKNQPKNCRDYEKRG